MKKKPIISILIFLWALVPFYYFTKNSLPTDSYVTTTVIKSALSLIVLNFSAFFLGGIFLKIVHADKRSFHLKRTYKIAIGYGVIFFTLLFIGLLGLFTGNLLTVYIATLSILAAIGIYQFIHELPVNTSMNNSGTDTILISAIVFVVALDLIAALVPPTVRDSLIHHLAIPKLYLKNGGIIPLDFMDFAARSLNLELLYTLALFIKNDIVARVIHFNFYLLSIIALYQFLRDAFRRTPALIGTLLFASTPVIFNVAASAYVDVGLTFFAIMLINALRQYHKEEDDIFVILAGVMAGICISTKVNGYLFVALSGGWLTYIIARLNLPSKEALKKLGIFILLLLLFDTHQIFKNIVQHKNPLYPAISLASGDAVTKDGADLNMAPIERRRLMYGMTLKDELMMPWALSTDVTSKAEYTVDGVLGPIFIIFMPFIIFIKRRRFEIYSFLTISALFTLICWGRFDIRLRYIFVLIPLAAFLVTAVIDDLLDGRDNTIPLPIITKLILSLVIAFTLTMNLYHIFNYISQKEPFAFLTAKMSRVTYLKKHYRPYRVFNYINADINDKDVLIYFLAFGNDGYYCEPDYTYDTYYLGTTFTRIVKKSMDAKGILNGLKARKITHILVDEKFLKMHKKNNYDAIELKRVDKFFNDHTKKLKSIMNSTIFELQ
ncbi:ArnT family glycosyltransferase [Thermodesulfobacteriota bacterium]